MADARLQFRIQAKFSLRFRWLSMVNDKVVIFDTATKAAPLL